MHIAPDLSRVVAVVQQLRELHPELATALTWDGLRRVLSREGILLAKVPLGRPAKLLGYEGVFIILVDQARQARHLWYATHEYGHYKLHVEHPGDRYECCFHMDDVVGDDPREHDADLFADLLLYGRTLPPPEAL